LRRSQKAVLTASGVGALLATGIGSIPHTHATTSPLDALRAQRAALVAELAAMQPSLHSAGSAASGAEAAYNQQQQRVLQEQAQIASLNQQLVALNQQLTSDQATVAKNKADLATIVRATFETTRNDQLLAAILSADNFSQAMDRLRNATQVSKQVSDLVTRVGRQDADIRADESRIKSDFAHASAIEADLAAQSQQLLAILVERNSFYNQLQGPARAVAAQIANLDQAIAFNEAGGHVGSGPCGDHFAFGQCTWYVASRRCIPWLGNAKDWYYAAAAMGFKEGHQPVPGAVVVFWPGGDGASSLGHVAYVEAVGPAAGIPLGYFKLSEMNYAGWDQVDYRVLPNNSSGIQGFIYGQ
jgi:surface antigen